MPKITFNSANGGSSEVDAPVGVSVMRAAVDNDVGGIVAECGGSAACATCHVYVDEEFLHLLRPPDTQEAQMLEFVATERLPGSRLACQILITDALDGMKVVVPDRQF